MTKEHTNELYCNKIEPSLYTVYTIDCLIAKVAHVLHNWWSELKISIVHKLNICGFVLQFS